MASEIDIEKLITAVFKRPIIWDKRHKLNTSRLAVDKCWQEISIKMGFEDIQLKKKWKYLRDQFGVEWGKHARSGHAAGDISMTTRWPYFKRLLFLKDIMKPRPRPRSLKASLSSDVPSSSRDVFNAEEVSPDISSSSVEINDESFSLPLDMDAQDETDNSQCEEAQGSESVCSREENGGKRKRHAGDDYDRNMLQIEERNLSYLLSTSKKKSAGKEDEDLMFLKSLLSHIKLIPPYKMLRFRRRLEELVEEFAYPVQVFPTGAPVHACSYQSYADHSSPQLSPNESKCSQSDNFQWDADKH